MKMIRPIRLLTVMTMVMFLLLVSCKKDDSVDPNPENFEYYVSHEYLTSYNAESIKNQFTTLQFLYPQIEPLLPKFTRNVEVYKIVYNTPFQGEVIQASGLVCIPEKIVDGYNVYPIISFQNGTNTSHSEAPTESYDGLLFRYVESVASMGYIVVIPDYIGFGSSDNLVHPYLDKESTVTSVENIILATIELLDTDTLGRGYENKVFMMGYSQGGWATLCTHKYISEKDSLPFNLLGSSCGAGPYDLSVVQNFMFEDVTYSQPVYMAYTAFSYSALGYVSNPLTDFFNEPYASAIPEYFDGSMSNTQINENLNDTVAVLMNNDFLDGINTNTKYQEFHDAMNNNSIYGWNTTIPIHLYHGTSDVSVPITTTEQVFQEFKYAGASAKVIYYPIESADHTTAAIPTVIGSLIWFNDLK